MLKKQNENKSRLTDKIKELEVRINVHQSWENSLLQNKEKLYKLHELGIIDSDGEYIEDK